jgi:hypothetical protein
LPVPFLLGKAGSVKGVLAERTQGIIENIRKIGSRFQKNLG